MNIPGNPETLEEGSDLDALCALHVMDYTLFPPGSGRGWHVMATPNSLVTYDCPCYSTDIGMAFGLVRVMSRNGFRLRIREMPDLSFKVSFEKPLPPETHVVVDTEKYWFQAVAKSAELGICRAALLAMKAKVDDRVKAGGYPLPEDWSPRGTAP